MAEPPIGAHLVTPRRGYTHHGIYAGEGTVIHYSGLSRGLGRGPVEEVSLARFANDQSVAIRCSGPLPFDMMEIVGRARSRLGESRYRLLSNNCEHFSVWAQFGLSRSAQVDHWVRAPRSLAEACLRRMRKALVVLSSVSDRLLTHHEGVTGPG
ncbi:MAG: lecithin retinol acyltransferase family protein [Steroidobacteraceae bacterium]